MRNHYKRSAAAGKHSWWCGFYSAVDSIREELRRRFHQDGRKTAPPGGQLVIMADRKEQTGNQDEDESFTKLSRLPVPAASGQNAVHSWRHAHAEKAWRTVSHVRARKCLGRWQPDAELDWELCDAREPFPLLTQRSTHTPAPPIRGEQLSQIL